MAKRLRDLGERHVILDSFEKGHRPATGGSPVVEADLRDRESIRRAFTTFPIEVVIHFAGSIQVGESVRQPAEYWRNNLVGTLNLLDAMREAGLSKLAFSSTAAVYGEPEEVPIPEEHPKRPTSPYGETKYAVEMALGAYERAYGLRSIALRYFNAAGSDPEGVLGEDHDPETHLIPAAILSSMGKTAPMQIFGTDYPTPDGTCVRDYVHVMDLVEAHLLAVRALREGASSNQFNLGNGQGFSVREVLQTVEEVTGLPIPHSEGPRRDGDPAVLVASSEKIRAELGWSPQYPDLRSMVSHAWNWRQAHPEGYRS